MTTEAFVNFLAGWFVAAIVLFFLASLDDRDLAERLANDFPVFGMMLILLVLAVLAKILGG